ncbi:hypothetical protein O181_029714 [Austropuccinia psidii MF-1]|uniref:Uncharacterized protein n=1 Tax=Austropuccinia psidii MF-1 TaxID=1389203 RepID=A0A9Q3H4U5_9BASI|nr:hypothetical protein [Austropuccinia psidii MF-1]
MKRILAFPLNKNRNREGAYEPPKVKKLLPTTQPRKKQHTGLRGKTLINVVIKQTNNIRQSQHLISNGNRFFHMGSFGTGLKACLTQARTAEYYNGLSFSHETVRQ